VYSQAALFGSEILDIVINLYLCAGIFTDIGILLPTGCCTAMCRLFLKYRLLAMMQVMNQVFSQYVALFGNSSGAF
jgi:hypothetical protein